MLYEETTGDLSIHQIMDIILMLRGDRPPTMKDMLHSQTFNRWKLQKALEAQSDSMHARLVHGQLSDQSKVDSMEEPAAAPPYPTSKNPRDKANAESSTLGTL